MKRYKGLPIILILIMVLIGCSVKEFGEEPQGTDEGIQVVKDFDGVDQSKVNKYDIEVDLDTNKMIYRGKQTINYVNNTGTDLDKVYFHLYPNAFGSYEEAPILFNLAESADKDRYEPGYINMEIVKEGDKDLQWQIEGKDNTILSLNFDKPLGKGKEKEIYLEYTVKLPRASDRFGYHNKGINVGNWYPIACVYDDNGWNLDPYYNLGDPFYSEVANYRVSIKTPKEYIIAGSGNLISEEEKEDKRTYIFEGELIRDFAWAASRDFVLKERMAGDTLIKLYSVKDDQKLIEKSLDTGEKSLKTFNRIFGHYPHDTLTIVNTEFPSGMEYPTLILISNDLFNKETAKALETVIVHEIAHQWWYGLVGNNQVREAWLDEGLTTYSEVIFNKEVYGDMEGKNYYNNQIKLGYDYSLQYLEGDTVVNRPLWEFQGWNDYGPLVYSRAAMFIHQIKEEFGEGILYEILNKYYDKYKFKIARTEDFIEICEEVTGTSFDRLVEEYLNGNK